MRTVDWILLGITLLAGIAAVITLGHVCVPVCEQGADCSWTGCGVQDPFFWVTAAVAIAAGVTLVVQLRRD